MLRRSLLLVPLLYCALAQAQSNRPNIVLIMTDDAGYGDLTSYGAPDVHTPVLDQLGREGVRFTNFYSNGPSCSPTRAGLMSGRYQQRYNIDVPLPAPSTVDGKGLTAEGHSLPALLKTAGYKTALIGKWHLGYSDAQSPQAHGFDYFFGFKAGYVDYYQHTNSDGKPDLWEQDQLHGVDGYMTDLITQKSVSYIEQHSNAPFFLSIQYNAPHWPYQRPGQPSVAVRNSAHLMPWEDNTSTRADYVAMFEYVDRGVGEVLRALDAAGLADNTLVIYTNDNGGEWLARNAPLFNRKLSVWEGGIRVPAMMRWPGVIPAGQVIDQVGITMDLSATMLALSGATLPAGYAPEGINLLPIVSRAAPQQERTLFWSAAGTSAVRSGDLKLVQQGPSSFFVFNVSEDPGERNDLTSVRQDDARRLHALLEAWKSDVGAEGATRLPASTKSTP